MKPDSTIISCPVWPAQGAARAAGGSAQGSGTFGCRYPGSLNGRVGKPGRWCRVCGAPSCGLSQPCSPAHPLILCGRSSLSCQRGWLSQVVSERMSPKACCLLRTSPKSTLTCRSSCGHTASRPTSQVPSPGAPLGEQPSPGQGGGGECTDRPRCLCWVSLHTRDRPLASLVQSRLR